MVLSMTIPSCLLVVPANAQKIHDPPWNPEHLDRLPAQIRAAVFAMCPGRPDAGHYFATYYDRRVTLHFEYFHCGRANAGVCNGSRCLHQVYELAGGRYRLVRSIYGSLND